MMTKIATVVVLIAGRSFLGDTILASLRFLLLLLTVSAIHRSVEGRNNWLTLIWNTEHQRKKNAN